jgi:hypothetical protein
MNEPHGIGIRNKKNVKPQRKIIEIDKYLCITI